MVNVAYMPRLSKLFLLVEIRVTKFYVFVGSIIEILRKKQEQIRRFNERLMFVSSYLDVAETREVHEHETKRRVVVHSVGV